jgi:tetratricopeptide (TPR) repeat protein
LAEPLAEEQAAQWLLWLQIGTVFDRLRMLPVSERAAYARGTAGLWETAERVTGAARFARVGAVMAEWSGEAPALDGFRELLWAVEQVEADGALWLSAHSLVSTQRLVQSGNELRWAYAAAQLGRMLRSVGHLSAADRQFHLAAEHAEKQKDDWLSIRTVLGLGVVSQARGNYPAAHDHYERASMLSTGHPDLLLAARIGLVSTSLTRGAHNEALQYARAVVESGMGERDEHAVEVLAMLADFGLEVGDFPAAMRACSAAMLRRPPRRKHPFFQRGLMISASILGDEALALASATEMERTVDQIANRWERAFSRLVVGRVLARHADNERGHRQTVLALAEAREHGFHEIVWKAEQSIESLLRRVSHTGAQTQLVIDSAESADGRYEPGQEPERVAEVSV